MKAFLGIDWGGTYIKVGAVSLNGTILKKTVYASEKLKRKQVFLDTIKSLLDSFRAFDIKAVGVGAPGIIDVKSGFIYNLPNVPGWEKYPLKHVLQNKINIPVFLDNDANVFALAEASLGAGRKYRRTIFLTLGTGLGGAIVLDNKILEGQTSALELGHVPIALEGTLCGCGGRGCIETYTGSNHLLDRYRALKKEKLPRKEVKEIFTAALKGEREALLVWEEFSRALGKFLAGMINIFNPEIIILGGGVSGAFRLFKPFLWKEIKQQAMWPQMKNLKLVKAKLKDAGIVGAALVAQQHLCQ